MTSKGYSNTFIVAYKDGEEFDFLIQLKKIKNIIPKSKTKTSDLLRLTELFFYDLF